MNTDRSDATATSPAAQRVHSRASTAAALVVWNVMPKAGRCVTERYLLLLIDYWPIDLTSWTLFWLSLLKGVPPATLAEFTFQGGNDQDTDFYDRKSYTC